MKSSKLHVPVSSDAKKHEASSNGCIGCVAKAQESHAASKAVAAANLIDGLLRLGDDRID
jgi:hypothetical protein